MNKPWDETWEADEQSVYVGRGRIHIVDCDPFEEWPRAEAEARATLAAQAPAMARFLMLLSVWDDERFHPPLPPDLRNMLDNLLLKAGVK